jgi:hypothetical protein
MIRPAAFLVAALALSLPVLGQPEATPQGAPQGNAKPSVEELVKLTSHSDLVLIPVIVTDPSGKHVSGLGKDAFPFSNTPIRGRL